MKQSIIEQFEGNDFAGFWKRVLISILDVIILAVPAYFLNNWVLAAAEDYRSAVPLLLQWLLLAAFNIWMVVRYGGTPARLLLQTRIIDEYGTYPTVKQAVIRYSFILVNSFLAVIEVTGNPTLSPLIPGFANWSPLAVDLSSILSLVIFIDCLVIVVTPLKRAFHDMMAGTYVVNKAALDEFK